MVTPHYDKLLGCVRDDYGSGAEESIASHTLTLDENAAGSAGAVYNSYSDCVDYINTAGGAGENNRWRIVIGSDITSDIELSPWIFLDGQKLGYQVQAKITESGESTETGAYAVYNAKVKTVDASVDHTIYLSDTEVYDQQTTTGGGVLYVTDGSALKSASLFSGYDVSSLSRITVDNGSGLTAVRTFSEIYAQTDCTIFFDNATGNYLSLIYGSDATVYGDMTVGELYMEKSEINDLLGTEKVTVNNAEWISIIDCNVFVGLEVDGVDLYLYSSVVGSSTISAINGGTITNTGAYYDNSTSGLSADDVQGAIDEIADILTSDTTVHLDNSMSASDIQDEIDAQPKSLNGYTLTFQFADGTYTLNDQLIWNGFYGGDLYIRGNDGDSDKTTAQSVFLDGTGVSGDFLRITNCPTTVHLYNIKAEAKDGGGYCVIRIISCQFARIRYCYFLGDNSGNDTIGTLVESSFADVRSNYYASLERGIQQNYAMMLSKDNDDTGGVMSAYGLASHNGVIHKSGTQPDGATSDETTGSGGVIR